MVVVFGALVAELVAGIVTNSASILGAGAGYPCRGHSPLLGCAVAAGALLVSRSSELVPIVSDG